MRGLVAERKTAKLELNGTAFREELLLSFVVGALGILRHYLCSSTYLTTTDALVSLSIPTF